MFELYNLRKEEFDSKFRNFFDSDKFGDILNYSIEEGKRIRPIILLETYKMLDGKNYQQALDYAISLELIHNYSLVHDDLPDMDDDDYRRGRETTHFKYGSDMAILAGDALLNYAYENVFNSLIKNNDANAIKAAEELGANAGLFGMIKGQISDINNDLGDLDKIIDMYLNKTCKLFISATTIAAILSGKDENTINSMRELGFYIGMAFQLQDDILDIEQDDKINKITYVSYAGIEKTKEDMQDYTNKALNILKNYDNNQFLIKLFDYLTERSV